MNFGMVLIWLAFLAVLVSTVLSVVYMSSGKRIHRIWSDRIEMLGLVSATLAIVTLIVYLIQVNTSYFYVYAHSSADLAWSYRFSALWAGQEGSLLLWVFAILAVVQYIGRTGPLADTRLMDMTRAVSLCITTVFLLILVLRNPFTSYTLFDHVVNTNNWDPFAPMYAAPGGQGMNPLLRNPWMAIHPPVLFLGYAAFTIPFAAAFASLIERDDRWVDIARTWMRIAWLFLTLGIGLGGFWAYEVLGWGAWYWSWDPVETSSLIPWVVSTAFLHASTRSGGGEYGFLAPLLAVMSFILVVFATFVTRSGMWASVHSWQDFSSEGLVIAIFLVLLVGCSVVLLARRYFEEDVA